MRALDLTTASWRKSSYSADTNTCVEVAFLDTDWRKSTHSSETATCVEVTFSGQAVGLRDSKNPTGPILTLPVPALTHLFHTA
jgi:hypothetical protein